MVSMERIFLPLSLKCDVPIEPLQTQVSSELVREMQSEF